MTDKEIEKALECCQTDEWHCNECSYYFDNGEILQECTMLLAKDALDYINRLKVEIARLSNSDQSKEDCIINQHAEIHRLRDELKQIRKDTAKEILDDLIDLAIKRDLTVDDINSLATVYGIEVEE